MKLSKTELKVLEQLAKGLRTPAEIAAAIKKSKAQVYRNSRKLKEKGFVFLVGNGIEPAKTIYANNLLKLLSDYPNLIEILSESGLAILTAIKEPCSANEISTKTGLKRAIIYRRLKAALAVSIIKKKGNKYSLNKKLWPSLVKFITQIQTYGETVDPRIPANSFIYFKSESEIVFSNIAPELPNAVPTGFSAYKQYGISILLPTNYYYFPKKQLTKLEIFQHSLYITKKDKNARNLTYVALFYLKFKKELQNIRHPVIDSIKRVLAGQTMPDHPTLDELKEKAELYDIRL